MPGLYIFKTLLHIKSKIDKVPQLGQNHLYSTRNRNQLATATHNTKTFETTPSYQGVKLFNKLPLRIQLVKESKKFKSAVFDYILDKTLYDVSDF